MLKLIPMNIKNNKSKSLVKPKVNLNNKIKPHFYIINFASDEESICKMEIKSLFNKVPDKKYFFSYHQIDPARSPFIKQCISIIYTGNTLEDIIHQIEADRLSYEDFKVCYMNYGSENVGYEERRRIEYLIGQNIYGEAELHSPKVLLGITRVHNRWIFGEYKANNAAWQQHQRKPYDYSNALGVRVARAIVNIAVSNNLKCSVIDPCCGIGTILIEALSLGINIEGYEINPMIGENAKKNLKYFDYEDVVTIDDMNNINRKFDVSIIDMPYGLFSSTTLEQQLSIIRKAREISNKMVIITFENMDKYIIESGFTIVDRCDVSKGKFKRYITICN